MSGAISNCKFAVKMFPVGEWGILVEFGREIHPDIHKKVKALTSYLDSHPFEGMIECMPAFCSVTVYYDPVKVRNLQINYTEKNQLSYKIVESLMQEILLTLDYSLSNKSRIVEIPVCYGSEFGPDLEYVAEYNKLNIDEVIEIHSSGEYLVYMIGFAPGFPYLGGMSEQISAPRRQSPRMVIPEGSVGIAGIQTGVYPISTPGGWQLIGRTPLKLFRPNEDSPSLLQSGDIIKFYSISYEEYKEYREGK